MAAKKMSFGLGVFALALFTGLSYAAAGPAAAQRGAAARRQGGLVLQIYPQSGPYFPHSNVTVSVVMKNVGDAPISVPSASKLLRLAVDDASGKHLQPAVENHCLQWLAVDNGVPVIAPGGARLEIASLRLQCYITEPGRYHVTALAHIDGLPESNAPNGIDLRSNTFNVAIPDPAEDITDSCKKPVKIVHVALPDYAGPPEFHGELATTVRVLLDDRGLIVTASVYDSSGDESLDRAALKAALESTYSSAGLDCPRSYDYRTVFSGQ